jgi:ABC-2 type transport system ATP-binding protein
MSIVVENLTKLYGKQLALNEVSFSVETGEIVGLIGPNGAGKSTLMKIISTLILPASGDVRINGVSVIESPLKIKEHLGYLPENNPLYLDLYVKEYLLHIAGLYKLPNSRHRVIDVINRTGLEPEMDKKIGLLSKGYRQRVGLAQAIIHDPEILILDEPTTGLDPNQIVEIRNLISDLGKAKTVILSTHIMQEVEAICRRVIILNKGCIVADEFTGELSNLSKNLSHTISVEFSNDFDDSVIKTIPGVQNIRKLKSGTWLIETSGKNDIRSDLFRFAVDNGYIILSMHIKDKRLEDVFRDLTQ